MNEKIIFDMAISIFIVGLLFFFAHLLSKPKKQKVK